MLQYVLQDGFLLVLTRADVSGYDISALEWVDVGLNPFSLGQHMGRLPARVICPSFTSRLDMDPYFGRPESGCTSLQTRRGSIPHSIYVDYVRLKEPDRFPDKSKETPQCLSFIRNRVDLHAPMDPIPCSFFSYDVEGNPPSRAISSSWNRDASSLAPSPGLPLVTQDVMRYAHKLVYGCDNTTGDGIEWIVVAIAGLRELENTWSPFLIQNSGSRLVKLTDEYRDRPNPMTDIVILDY